MLTIYAETMFFGNVGQLKDRLRRIEVHGDLGVHTRSEPSGPQTRAIIFEMASVGALDASATQTLLEIVEAYTNRGIAIRFVKVREACKVLFDRAGIRLGLCHRKIADALEDLGFYALTASTYPAHQPIPSPSPTSPYSTAVHALHKSP